MHYEGKLYKYLTPEATIAVLGNSSLKFSKASEFNDPFDTSLGSLFGTKDSKEYYQQSKEVFIKALTDEEPGNIFKEVQGFEALKEVIKKLDEETKESFLEQLKEEALDGEVDFESRDKVYEKHKRDLQNHLYGNAICCFSEVFDNILMWSHYASEHKGAVFEFDTSILEDSFLKTAKRVNYSKERPTPLASDEDHKLSKFERARTFSDAIIYTKSDNWAYERELRVVIPCDFEDGSDIQFFSFSKKELTKIYLGVRASQSFRDKVSYLIGAQDIETVQLRCSNLEFKVEPVEDKE